MKLWAKNVLNQVLNASGREVVATPRLNHLTERALEADKIRLLEFVDDSHLREGLNLIWQSPSQLGQDIFAWAMTGYKRNGYFVEFGATDGKTLSNTWLLDHKLGWTGILAEPGRVWRTKLEQAERNAIKEYDCVWSKTGETLTFRETDYAELSTVQNFSKSDSHDRNKARTYEVKTISLVDLLDRHGAPATMDYLSIDTEGSEFTILEAFDFSRYRFRCITVEHNRTPLREQIHSLLVKHGYERRFEELSRWDDWYVLKD